MRHVTPDYYLAGRVCPLCLTVGKIFRAPDVRLCDKHNVLLSFPWNSEEEYDSYYADLSQFHTAQQIEEGFLPSSDPDRHRGHVIASQSRMRLYTELVGCDKTCLDVGAGTGAFVEAANCFGWKAIGIELCPSLTVHNKVFNGGWKDVIEERDVITLHDVLEHLTRPYDALCHLKECLTPDGRLVVEMPLYEGQGPDWRHIRPKQHICLYSKLAAEELFRCCNLSVEAFWKPCCGKLDKAVWILSA